MLSAEDLVRYKLNESLNAQPGTYNFCIYTQAKGCAMSDIEKALENFVSVCKKYVLTVHFEALDALDNVFPAKLPCSAELHYFYKNYNPEGLKIETGFTPIKLHSVNELEKAQTGYSYFPDNYLVIGDDLGGGKPIVAVVDTDNTAVYANYDVGEPFKIANSFSDFIMSLTNLIDLVYGSYDIFDVADDSDELKEDFIEKLRVSISPVIGKENLDAFFDYFYG